MIPYDPISQVVEDKVYSLHHLWSSFHLHNAMKILLIFMKMDAVNPHPEVIAALQDCFIGPLEAKMSVLTSSILRFQL
jgi:hypothetical protein